jgi:hypothetical protein
MLTLDDVHNIINYYQRRSSHELFEFSHTEHLP